MSTQKSAAAESAAATYMTLKALWAYTYNSAYAEAVRTATDITSEELVASHSIARKIAAETVASEKRARQDAYLRRGYRWCIEGCGALCSPGWAFCPQCEPNR